MGVVGIEFSASGYAASRAMRILLLQDGSCVADELARMLGHHGFMVDIVPCSEQMACAVTTRGCDLLIVDLSLRAADCATAPVRMLVLASYKQIGERVQALEMGDCLAKLLEVVRASACRAVPGSPAQRTCSAGRSTM